MDKKEERNLLEKITFLTGILTLIILLGYLIFQVFKKEDKPPELSVNFYKDASVSSVKYRVEVENLGQKTAESTIINFDLYHQGNVSAQAALNIDYVPVQSKEIGYIVFPGQKAPVDSIVISSISYIQP